MKPFTVHSQHPNYPETTLQIFCVPIFFFHYFSSKLLCYNNTNHKAVIISTLRPDQKLTEPITSDKLSWVLNWASNVASIPSTTVVYSTVVCPYVLITKIFTVSLDLKKKVNTCILFWGRWAEWQRVRERESNNI